MVHVLLMAEWEVLLRGIRGFESRGWFKHGPQRHFCVSLGVLYLFCVYYQWVCVCVIMCVHLCVCVLCLCACWCVCGCVYVCAQKHGCALLLLFRKANTRQMNSICCMMAITVIKHHKRYCVCSYLYEYVVYDYLNPCKGKYGS